MKWDSSAFKAYEVSEVAGKKSVQRLGGFHKEGHQWGYDNITYIYTIIYICIYIYIYNFMYIYNCMYMYI